MKDCLQRGLIVLLAVLMVASSLPLNVLAENVQSGQTLLENQGSVSTTEAEHKTILDSDTGAELEITAEPEGDTPGTATVTQFIEMRDAEDSQYGNLIVPEKTIQDKDSDGEKTYQVTAMAEDALTGIEALKAIVIPDTITTVPEALYAQFPQAVVYCNAGSVPEQYAIDHGMQAMTDAFGAAVDRNTLTQGDIGWITVDKQPEFMDAPICPSFTSDHPEVAAVDEMTGELKAEQEGTAIVTADLAGLKAPVEVTVSAQGEEESQPDAEVETQASSGTCGENLTWTLDDAGTLTISGTGAMTEFKDYSTIPWRAVNKTIKEVVIEKGITNISNEAFEFCDNLISVTIPDSVNCIGSDAFSGCVSLENMTIPSSVMKIGPLAFFCCEKLRNITIPMGVKYIPTWTFAGCHSLESITIPSSVTNIGEGAFSECNISDIIIPPGVIEIGGGAFANCSNLTSITIPNSVIEMDGGTFAGCSSLADVTLPMGIKEIGKSAFYSCINLKSITIPDGVTSIGDSAFYGCSSLISVSIPSSVIDIGDSAFAYCGRLTSIVIPNGVTRIGEKTFYECVNLASITIPDGVESIGAWGFGYCSKFTSIKIPSSVTSIGDNAFAYCSNLMNITIPSSVTSIGEGAFIGCNNLDVWCNSNSYTETYANEKNIPFMYTNNDTPSNENKTVISIPGKVEYSLSGKDNYEVAKREVTTLDSGTEITSQLIVKGTLNVDGVGALTIGNGGELIIDGTANTGDLVVNGGGKLTVRSGGALSCGNLTVQSGFQNSFMGIDVDLFGIGGKGVLELHSGSTTSISDLNVKNSAYMNMYEGSKLLVKGNWNMSTFATDSQLYGGDLYIAGVINQSGNNHNIAATDTHNTIFYKAGAETPINSNDKQYRLGNVYVADQSIANQLNACPFNSYNYCGKYQLARITQSPELSYKPGKDCETADNAHVNWESTVNTAFSNIADSGAYQITCSRLTEAQKKEVNQVAAVWVSSLKMPIYDGMLDIGGKVYYLKTEMYLREDKKKHEVILYCNSFGMGNYSNFATANMIIKEADGSYSSPYLVGMSAKGDIEKYAEQAGEYVRDEFFDEYLKYLDGALAPLDLFGTRTCKVNKDLATKFIKKVLCQKYVTEKDESLQEVYGRASGEVTKWVNIVDMGTEALDAITSHGIETSGIGEMAAVAETESADATAQGLKQEILDQAENSTMDMAMTTASVTVTDEQLKAKLAEVLGTTASGDLDYSKASGITSLNLDNLYIQNLTGLENFTNLKVLTLANNEVSDLAPLATLKNLEYLDITGMRAANLSALSSLDSLKVLIANTNKITDVSGIKGLTKLTFLGLSGNEISDISPLSGLSAVETLVLSGNPLGETGLNPVAALPGLKKLEAGNCGLVSVSPFTSTNLKSVQLGSNALTDTSCLAAATALTEVGLSYNALTDLSGLSGLTELQILDLSGNQGINSLTPLSALTKLYKLNLSSTLTIDSFLEALKGLTALNDLDLSDNPICGIAYLSDLPALVKINVTNTALSESDQEYLKEKGIQVEDQTTPVTVRSLYFPKDTVTCTAGEVSIQAVCTYPTEGNLTGATWTSSNTGVATVDENGMVTGIKGGTAVIKVALGDLAAEYTVTVEKSGTDFGTLGDVNDDGQINASDALQDLRHSVKEIILDGDAFTRGNVVATDDVINASDALQILRYSVKEITAF